MTISFYHFLILLTLSESPQHGYSITQQIQRDTSGTVILGPGTMYGSLKQLAMHNLIEPIPLESDSRRHSYRLTKKGWDTLKAESPKYANIGKLIHERIDFDPSLRP